MDKYISTDTVAQHSSEITMHNADRRKEGAIHVSPFAANTLSVLSACPVCYHGYSHSLASEGPPFFLRNLLSESEKVLDVTWSIYWSWSFLGSPLGAGSLYEAT